MTKTTAQATPDEFNNNTSVEILRMQTHRGLKEQCLEKNSIFHKWADVEIDIVAELGLVEDVVR